MRHARCAEAQGAFAGAHMRQQLFLHDLRHMQERIVQRELHSHASDAPSVRYRTKSSASLDESRVSSGFFMFGCAGVWERRTPVRSVVEISQPLPGDGIRILRLTA